MLFKGQSLSQRLVKIGTLHAISFADSGLDWALVKIDVDNFVSLTLDQDTRSRNGFTESALRKFGAFLRELAGHDIDNSRYLKQ